MKMRPLLKILWGSQDFTFLGVFFGPLRSGWDLWFSLRLSVCSVEISKTAHRIVVIFAQSCNLIMWRMWRFFIILIQGLVSKNEVFGIIWKRFIRFAEIWPKVAEYGLSSFEANLYVRKDLDVKIIHLILLRTIGLRKVFELRYEQKLYLTLLGESNGMRIDPYMWSD